MKILGVEYDPLTGVKTTYGAEDGKMIVKTEQDVAPHLDYTQALRNDPDYAKRGIKQNFQHIGHIPNSVVAKMLTEDGFDVMRFPAREVVKFLRKNWDKYGKLIVTASGRL
jgi:hypothetical protein